MKIVLLRHGPPTFKAHWLTPARGARQALELYAASRVMAAPPSELHEPRTLANICVTSNLPRAIDSARILGFSDTETSELFNESELPHPSRLLVPMPWSLFLLAYRILWLFGLKQNCPGKSKDTQRARAASQHLIDIATKNDSVVLVGHGIMNRLLCAQLQNSGWQLVNKSGSGYWSSMTLHPSK